jgi:hypothetical protein
MNEIIDIKRMQKMEVRLGLRISASEREVLEAFCREKGILLSGFLRYAARKVMEEINGKK